LHIIYLKVLNWIGLNNKIVNIFNKKKIGGKYFRRKGHLLKSPSQNKINEIRLSLLKKARMYQWRISNRSESLKHDDMNWPQRPTEIIDSIVISITDNDNWDSVAIWEQDTEIYPGITCHFFINTNAVVTQTSEVTNLINHTPGISTRSLNVMVQYKAHEATLAPPLKVCGALTKLLTVLCIQYKLDPLKAIKGQWKAYNKIGKPVRKIPKDSPGVLFPIEQIKQEVAQYMQNKLRYASLYFGKVFPSLNNAAKNALLEFDSEAMELMYYNFKANSLDEGLEYDDNWN